MSSAEFPPTSFPRIWDVITIGGVTSPGVAQVGETKREYSWDEKKGKGSDGATLSYTGRGAAKVSIKFLLWEDSHFDAWDTFRMLFKYAPTKKAVSAIDIYHPSLADLGLLAFVTESLGSIVHEGQQLYSCTVNLIEYNPPPKKSAVSTPSGSKTAADGTSPGARPDPIADAQQKEVDRLMTIAGLGDPPRSQADEDGQKAALGIH